MSTYSDKLKHPKWQKKRLGVFNRAKWKCQRCGETEKPLHVHHKRYDRSKEPWDYRYADLECLCEMCHKKEHKKKPRRSSKKTANGYLKKIFRMLD